MNLFNANFCFVDNSICENDNPIGCSEIPDGLLVHGTLFVGDLRLHSDALVIIRNNNID